MNQSIPSNPICVVDGCVNSALYFLGGLWLCSDHAARPDKHVAARDDALEVNAVTHPAHYGGADDVYEAIKVIHAWRLNFPLGSVLKYIKRAGKKHGADELEDL